MLVGDDNISLCAQYPQDDSLQIKHKQKRIKYFAVFLQTTWSPVVIVVSNSSNSRQ